MRSRLSSPKKLPLLWVLIGAGTILCLVSGLAYLNRPVHPTSPESTVSPEAKDYLRAYLELSDISMKSTENFMKQQVLEIEGKISNKGPRPVQAIDVTGIFSGIDGHELYRERVPVVRTKDAPLKSGETRPFRLPFDNLPDGWNQTLPRLVIARLIFAQ